MRKICFSLPPALVVRQLETLLLGECMGSLREGCAGRWCWELQSGERRREETPSHSLLRQEGEAEREETQPGLGWSGVKGRTHLLTEGGEEVEGCRGLVKVTAVGMKRGYLPWHYPSLRAEVSACPIGRLHTEPLQRLPERHQRLRSEQETESVGKAVQGPEGPVWHLWGRAEN